jgi:iron complex transport system substrate-binding protein
VILGEGRLLQVLGIFDTEDPTARVVGMLADFERLDPDGYAAYAKRFPAIDDILRFGVASEDSFSVEQAIALEPDVAIFGIEGHGPSAGAAEVIKALEAAGTAVVFVDFRQKPLENSEKSVELLGKVLGKEERAAAFLEVYRAEMAKVTEPLAKAGVDKPSVFIDSRVGLMEECCGTMGNGMLGQMVDLAGAENMGTALLPGVAGNVSLEYLLTHQPDIYMGTGIGTSKTLATDSNRIALGAGISAEQAEVSFDHSLKRLGIADLDAVREARAYAMWHHFYNTPLHVAAVQRMAKWFHPDLFADLDPEATLEMLYDEYQAVPLEGVYWTEK